MAEALLSAADELLAHFIRKLVEINAFSPIDLCLGAVDRCGGVVVQFVNALNHHLLNGSLHRGFSRREMAGLNFLLDELFKLRFFEVKLHHPILSTLMARCTASEMYEPHRPTKPPPAPPASDI